MRRTTRALFGVSVLVLTLGVAACADEEKTDPVAITGSFTGTEWRIPADKWESFPVAATQEFVVDGDTYTCSQPANALLLGKKTGELSDLGKVTREESACVVLDLETGASSFVDADFVLIAANGDRLGFVGTGIEVGDTDDDGWTGFVSTVEFAGGTGRFASATGGFTETGRTDFNQADAPVAGVAPYVTNVTATISGEITYNASDRAAK